MTRPWWARTSGVGAPWHYFAHGKPRGRAAACGGHIDPDLFESHEDGGAGAEVPDPVCPHCYLCRCAVEEFRRSIVIEQNVTARLSLSISQLLDQVVPRLRACADAAEAAGVQAQATLSDLRAWRP